jgi:hypothetical protein
MTTLYIHQLTQHVKHVKHVKKHTYFQNKQIFIKFHFQKTLFGITE